MIEYSTDTKGTINFIFSSINYLFSVSFNNIITLADEALLFAVTPAGRCVGIRIFPQKPIKIEKEEELDNYVEKRLKNAINLKSKIECGFIDSDCSEIVNDLPASWSDIVEKIILSQRQCKLANDIDWSNYPFTFQYS